MRNAAHFLFLLSQTAALHRRQQAQPELRIEPPEINSRGAVNVSWRGVVPTGRDFIVGSYEGNPEAVDFFRSVLHDGPPPPFVFHPTNLRTRTLTFFYVRASDFGTDENAHGASSSTHDDSAVPTGKVLASGTVAFRSANEPVGVHLSLTDDASAVRVTWVSNASKFEPRVMFGKAPDQLHSTSVATSSSFAQADLCSERFGVGRRWYDRGQTHTAVMSGLMPGTTYYYRVGQPPELTDVRQFRTQADRGAPTRVLLLGDLGVPINDTGYDTEMQSVGVLNDYPLQTMRAIVDLGEENTAASTLLVGDLSYACGTMAKWDFYLGFIERLASSAPFMVVPGNHEVDDPALPFQVGTVDSGGECGVPYRHYFPQPTATGHILANTTNGRTLKLPVLYGSWNQGLIHFVSFNTEDDFTLGSDQLLWLERDLAAVNRSATPWIVFGGHRPYLVSSTCSGWAGPGGPNDRASTLGRALENALEPIFEKFDVNLALWGHVHDFERTCAVRYRRCVADGNGTTHVIIGNAGHGVHSIGQPNSKKKDPVTGCGMWIFPEPEWIAYRSFEHGYSRLTAYNTTSLHFEAIFNRDRQIHDEVWLTRRLVTSDKS